LYRLNDGSDTIRFADLGVEVAVSGGRGADRIASNDYQTLYADGGAGDDVVLGGSADDALRGGPGADVLNGREGPDATFYDERSRGVTVTLDGRANDGARGEHDLVMTEYVYGGSGPDRIVGGDGEDGLHGFGGDDHLVGGRADDSLGGYLGNDTLRGSRGDDELSDTVAGDDELHGGRGADALWAGRGADEFWGGPGDDGIESGDLGENDGALDRIHCGPGQDSVFAGAEDFVSDDCETVSRRTWDVSETAYVNSIRRTTVSLLLPSSFVR
jgi:Ca2+-binding RTX toxin-like protein